MKTTILVSTLPCCATVVSASPIRLVGELKEGERVFSESRSLIFKKIQVVRFFDQKRQTYVYLAYSDRMIEGSPQNAISTVPIKSWPSR